MNAASIARAAALAVFVVSPASGQAPGQSAAGPPQPSPSEVRYTGEAAAPPAPLSLWYRRPAAAWVEALPIGNGRLGAMVFGGVDRERLQLNEDTLWAGGPYDPVNPEAKGALPEVRRLIFDGRYPEAAALVKEKVLAKPVRQMPYETVGDLFLTFPRAAAVDSYRRDLDLDSAVATVSYKVDGVTFTRQVFSSPVDQVIVVRLTADRPGSISFAATMATPQRATVVAEDARTLVLDGVNGESSGVAGRLRFQARVTVLARGGRQQSVGAVSRGAPAAGLEVSGADSAVVLIAAATSYRNYEDVGGDPAAIVKRQVSSAAARGFKRLLAAHLQEHRRLFRRVTLDLGANDAARLPTDERIRRFPESDDAQFAALYFQYGRYLLISSSRPGTQPAGLQGIWNESMTPPWGGKYTININTEMNYWPAETANLAECVEPLVAMVADLAKTGARTAAAMYGASGWVVHHNTDLWRATAPIDQPDSGMWPTGGAWLCLHLWDHYEYSGDRAFLAAAYPMMKGAALFFLDTLVEEPTHKWLVTNPSLSPENRHPFGTSVAAGPTMDEQILRDLFSNCMQAAEILGVDGPFRARLAAARARLAPTRVGAAGQIQEWLDDWDARAKDQKHRHISHLYGLYPSRQIDVFDTPGLAAAAKVTLNTRGDIATGWAIAWRINCWARLHDGDRTLGILEHLFSPSRTYPNMFDAHPPFQIDGNFGGASGIAEMLLQSRRLDAGPGESGPRYEIEVLPALPSGWKSGSVRGLRARGGFEVDLSWKDGRLVEAAIRSLAGQAARVRLGRTLREVSVGRGGTFRWDGR